ncbi:hypothetical protein HJ010_00505 [Vibrio parahaemolyticus]|nr:hypothetical protein [Vibrio parahaemolyticus]HCM1323115.1 hypothetical protein [Vibrio parahaemolyticus]HCM1328041.1 hypothetical protein [Vibrio parahaemolyticus]
MTVNNVVITNILIVLSFITDPIAWADDSLFFVLNEDDIQGVFFEEHIAWLKLSTSATEALTELTNSTNQGKLLEISVEDLHVVKAHINATISSGIIMVDNPSADLKHLLKEIELSSRQK